MRARAARSAAAWVGQDARREHQRCEWCSRLASWRTHTVPTYGRHPSPSLFAFVAAYLLRFVSVDSVSPFVNSASSATSATSGTSETSLPPLGGKLVQRSRRECAVLRHGQVAQRERLS